MKTKTNIRNDMQHLFVGLKPSDIFSQSELISSKLQQNMRPHRETIAIFKPLGDEPQIQSFFCQLQKSANILLPWSDTDDPYLIGPNWNRHIWSVDLFIIPWVVFGATGDRIGRWWGRYDRLLMHHPDSYKIWICFAHQLLDTVPHEHHDICMDQVITWV